MRKLAIGFLLTVLMFPPVKGQSPEHPQTTAAEKKKAADEREKKNLALMEEILNNMQSLRLPENRIRVAMSIAGQLWPRDEKRALALFKDAAASLNELAAVVASGDPNYLNLTELPQQLRQEMIDMAVHHDPNLAVEFLRATRTNFSNRPTNPGMTNLEANLEMRVATQIAAKDPDQALALAEESLKVNVDYGALNFLQNLQSQRKALAERFLDDLMAGIRTSGIGNNQATPIALNLLRTWVDNNHAAQDPSASRTTANLSLSNLNESTAREISNIILDALTSNASSNTIQPYGRRYIDGSGGFYPGQLIGIYQQIKPILPDIEKLVPNRMGALRTKMAEFEQTAEAQQNNVWTKFQEVAQHGTTEAILEAVRTAPPEYADSFLQQAAMRAINQGDEAQARQFVEKISDPRQRVGMNMQIARQGYYRAIEQKKLADARALISSLPLEEQVSLLAQMANSAATDGDRAVAFQLLGEAQALLPNRPRGYGLLQAQLAIAAAYERLDPERGAPIVEKVIDQTNELVAAAQVLDGFDVSGYFRNDEFVIGGGNPLNMIAETSGRELGTIARGDLDRARLAAERFQRPEMRLIALLQIAQAAITSEMNVGS